MRIHVEATITMASMLYSVILLFAAAHIEQVASGVKFVEPFGTAFDSMGNLYVVEFQGNRITRIDRSGEASIFAGAGKPGFAGDGGPAAQAAFHEPHGLVINKRDEMFVADTHNNRVRKIDLKIDLITTIAGTGEAGFSGDGGPATKATFKGIFAIDLAPSDDRLYLADLTNRRVRMVDLKSGIVTTIAGNGEKGIPQDGAKAADSPLVDPRAVAAGKDGAVYILERGGNALRVVDKLGRIRTLIKPGDITPDMKGPKHLCVDRNGDVIIADAENHLVRLYDVRTGRTTTIAGTGAKGNKIVPNSPTGSELNRPHGVYVRANGDLYITDSYNHRLLRVTRSGKASKPEKFPVTRGTCRIKVRLPSVQG
jgi:sugar lactone lactonase YvrE